MKFIRISALAALFCLAAHINASFSDFGRRFGANGYLNNMPLYYKDGQGNRKRKQSKNYRHVAVPRKTRAASNA